MHTYTFNSVQYNSDETGASDVYVNKNVLVPFVTVDQNSSQNNITCYRCG